MTKILDTGDSISEVYTMEGRRISLILVNGSGSSLDFKDPDGDWHSMTTFEGTYIGAVPFTVPGVDIRISAASGAKAWIVTS